MKTSELANFDNNLRKQHGPYICGTDEAGRGSWAGPLAAGAVIFPPEINSSDLPNLNDSKKLTADQRAGLIDKIKSVALGWHVVMISASDIDTNGIQWANEEAMIQASLGAQAMADQKVNLFVVDQVSANLKLLRPHLVMPKADGTSLSVAAASVITKVTRDLLMLELHEKYPDYGLDRHHGYPHPDHVASVNRHGRVKGLHRYSWVVKGYNRPVQMTLANILGEM